MSNTLLQNAGFETFLNIEDFEDPAIEDDLFGEISSFTHDIWTNTECNKMEDDDLPLTKYLLQFHDEEQWDSEGEFSVEGESFENETGVEPLGWAMEPVDLDTEIFDSEEVTCDKTDASSKEEEVKELKGSAKKSSPVGKASKVENLQDVVVRENCKKQDFKKKTTAGKNVANVDSLPSGGNTVKSKVESQSAVKNVSNPGMESQKSLTYAKTQAEKAKAQRERKKKYVKELQDTIEELKKDKAGLQKVNTQLNERVEALMDEIRYLKGVITNQSELATILRSVANTPGISLSCSVLQDSEGNDGKTLKRKCENPPKNSGKKGVNLRQENNKKRKVDKNANVEMSPVDAGVCVHVQSGKVSLEFCAECSKKANSVIN
ncbi:uncharacterized protein LOC144637292 isoform X1 [Oculina patagonica]